MATINFATNETGDFSEYPSSAGTISIQSTTKRTGTYALRSNPTTTATGFAGIFPVAATGGPDQFATIATSYLRTYFQYLTKPASNSEPIFVCQTKDVAAKFELRINSTGNLVALDAAGSVLGTGSTVLASGTWYRIEVQVGSSATVGPWEVRIDGVTELSGTGNLNATGADIYYLGKRFNRNGNTVDFYFDDTLISDSAFPGAGYGGIMIPNANGFYTSGTAVGISPNYACLQQIPSDGDTTYIDALLATQAYTAKVTSSGVGAGPINCVKAMILTRNLGAGGSQSTRLRSNGTDSDTTAVAATSSYAAYNKLFDTDPHTSAAWTVANLDAAEVGMVESVVGNRLTAAFILFDYTPQALAKTTTDVPTTSESVTRVLAGLRSATAAPSTSEAVTRALAALRTTTESLSIASATATRVFVGLRTATDSPSTSESVSRVFIGTRTTTDAPHTAESVGRVLAALRATTDAPHTAEVVSRIAALSRATADTQSTSDTASRTASLIRIAADTPTLADSSAVVMALVRATTDATTTSDSATKLFVGLRTLSESAATTDTAAISAVLLRYTVDFVSSFDAVTSTYVGVRSTVETLATSEDTSRILVAGRTATDSLSSSEDAVSAVGSVTRVANDFLTTSDSAARGLYLFRTATEGLTTSDTVAVGQVLLRTAAEAISTIEGITYVIVPVPPPPVSTGPVFGPGLHQRAMTEKKKRKERERVNRANRKRDIEAVAVWLMLN